eukprot:1225145-Rhodomonas_salina.1
MPRGFTTGSAVTSRKHRRRRLDESSRCLRCPNRSKPRPVTLMSWAHFPPGTCDNCKHEAARVQGVVPTRCCTRCSAVQHASMMRDARQAPSR